MITSQNCAVLWLVVVDGLVDAVLVHVVHQRLEDGLHALRVPGRALFVHRAPLALDTLRSLTLKKVALLVVESPIIR